MILISSKPLKGSQPIQIDQPIPNNEKVFEEALLKRLRYKKAESTRTISFDFGSSTLSSNKYAELLG
jgi:hypothetical protein